MRQRPLHAWARKPRQVGAGGSRGGGERTPLLPERQEAHLWPKALFKIPLEPLAVGPRASRSFQSFHQNYYKHVISARNQELLAYSSTTHLRPKTSSKFRRNPLL